MNSIRQSTLKAKNKALRQQLFPKMKEDDIWRPKVGYAMIPRSLPTLMVLMDELSPKKPVGSTYFALWCRSWDDPLIRLGGKHTEIAFEAGFRGQRPANTLTTRFSILKDLGLVQFAQGPAGPYSYAVVPNPYFVIRKQRKKIPAFCWNALLERMNEIGAKEYEYEVQDPQSVEFDQSPVTSKKPPVKHRKPVVDFGILLASKNAKSRSKKK